MIGGLSEPHKKVIGQKTPGSVANLQPRRFDILSLGTNETHFNSISACGVSSGVYYPLEAAPSWTLESVSSMSYQLLSQSIKEGKPGAHFECKGYPTPSRCDVQLSCHVEPR